MIRRRCGDACAIPAVFDAVLALELHYRSPCLKPNSKASPRTSSRPPAVAATSTCRQLSPGERYIIQHESGGSTTAKNPGSSAFGLGQLLIANRRHYLGANANTTDAGAPAQGIPRLRPRSLWHRGEGRDVLEEAPLVLGLRGAAAGSRAAIEAGGNAAVVTRARRPLPRMIAGVLAAQAARRGSSSSRRRSCQRPESSRSRSRA